MKILRLVFLLVAAGFAAAARADAPVSEGHPAMYSFADIYRLTVSGTSPQLPAAAEPQIRVATVQSAPAAELRFTVKQVGGHERWWLLVAGLAAIAWVAHRRLTRSL